MAPCGCKKIKGISELPLTPQNKCDKRDPCDIIADQVSYCLSTALDRAISGKVLSDKDPILTCSSKCSANSVNHKINQLGNFNLILKISIVSHQLVFLAYFNVRVMTAIKTFVVAPVVLQLYIHVEFVDHQQLLLVSVVLFKKTYVRYLSRCPGI